jgi:phage-related holin
MDVVTSWVIARLREGSTWGGIGKMIAGLAFLPHAAEIGALIPTVGVLVTGVIQILIPENK